MIQRARKIGTLKHMLACAEALKPYVDQMIDSGQAASLIAGALGRETITENQVMGVVTRLRECEMPCPRVSYVHRVASPPANGDDDGDDRLAAIEARLAHAEQRLTAIESSWPPTHPVEARPPRDAGELF